MLHNIENFKNNTPKRKQFLVYWRNGKFHRQHKLFCLEATPKTRTKFTHTKAVRNDPANQREGQQTVANHKAATKPPEGEALSLSISKVVTDLGSCHKTLQLCALHALAKYLRVPQNVPEVLTNTAVVELAVNVYLSFKWDGLMCGKEIEQTLKIFYYLTTHSEGAEKLMHHTGLLHNWYQSVLKRDINMELISKILRNLTLNRKVTAYLVDHINAFAHLRNIFQRYSSKPYPDALWVHLSRMLKRYPRLGVQENFFEILYDCVYKNPECCQDRVYQCLGHMLRAEEGLEFFRKIDGLQLLYTKLCEDILTNYEYIVYAIMQALHHKGMTRKCYRLSYLPDLLVYLAGETKNERVQLYCLKSLRLLGRECAIKACLRKLKYRSLLDLKCLSIHNQWARNKLCSWLKADRSERMMRALLELSVNQGCEKKSDNWKTAEDLTATISESYPSWSNSDSSD